MTLHDPDAVHRDYATECGLAARKHAYRFAVGPDPRELAFQAVAEAQPRRILEVGCGEGELAERMQRELGADVVALDQSERMVELTRARGVEAIVGDVVELPFRDGEFDCAVAAWMLFHVADVDRALAELARVLRPGGRLVAVTNGREHVAELYELLAAVRGEPSTFSAENGGDLLAPHFSRVDRIDASGWLDFPDRDAAQEYVRAAQILARWGDLPPFEGALRVRRAPCVFVADK